MSDLDDGDKALLLEIARRALTTYLETRRAPTCEVRGEALRQCRATFVTLRRAASGELRGCRGECVPRRALWESVEHMAVAAATDDPRFPAVTLEEVPALRIEISVLTPLAPIRPRQVEVGRHGLMIVKGARTGLLLPEVPVAQGWNGTAFLRGVCRKAELPPDAWQDDDVQLLAFETEVWGDEGREGRA